MADPTGKAKQETDFKQQRLAEALRANLHRRKAQARGRAEPVVGGISESDEGVTEEGGPIV